ncbi:MAG TPA: proteasome ATPase [Acidimicrobiales bacterium]|nr:proteasome ATPase [Acidimicrobiales bacterium]
MSNTDLKKIISELEEEISGMRAHVESLRERNTKLTESNSLAPKRIALLESRLKEAKALLAKAAGENQKLTNLLGETRDQITSLKVEVEKLSQPPVGYGTFLGVNEDGTVDIDSSGRKLRVNTHPEIDVASLVQGQEVALNESLNVIIEREGDNSGEIVTLIEILRGGERALVKGRADQEYVMHLSSDLQQVNLKPGSTLLSANKTNLLIEEISRPEFQQHLLYEMPDTTYLDIGGLDTQIEQIKDAIELPFMHPELYEEHKLHSPKGILLYGPPGCGKTLIAKAIANSLAKKVNQPMSSGPVKSYFFNIKGPELLNKFVGETERQIRLIFEQAREISKEGWPVIIFFDEMESLYRIRGSGISSDMESTIVPQLLAELDGVEALNNVVVIGASNREDLIDPAILRPGRLDIKIRIDRPTQDAAISIFSHYLTSNIPIAPIAIEELGGGDIDKAVRVMIEKTVDEMYAMEDRNEFLEVTYQNGDKQIMYFKDFASGAMIENIVRRSKKLAIKRLIETKEKGMLLEDLLNSIREEFNEQEDLPNTTNPDDWAKISGKKGERITYIRTLLNTESPPASRQNAAGQYL